MASKIAIVGAADQWGAQHQMARSWGPGNPAKGNMALWLKADAYTGLADNDTATAWIDQSVNGRNSTVVNTPTYQTNEINGLPIIRFDGVDDAMTCADQADYSPSVQDITVYMVLRTTTTTASVALCKASSTFEWAMRPYDVTGTNANVSMWQSAGASHGSIANTGGWTSGVPFIFTFALDYLVTGYVYVNGAAAVTTSSWTSTMSNTASTLNIGRRGDPTQHWAGDIAEIIIYNTLHSAAARGQTHAYLADKYNIALAGTN